jgi:mannosyl-oligosaccharide alpha-1,2-mannosidase
MNLTHEYNVARTHVRALDFTLLTEISACNGERGPNVHLFETVIRYLGGLLSAFEYVRPYPNYKYQLAKMHGCSLSGDRLMLRRAQELGDWLLPAFNTASGWPVPFYNLGE